MKEKSSKKSGFSISNLSFSLVSIVSILAGVVFFVFPRTIQNLIAIVLGIVFIILGIVGVISFIRTEIKTALTSIHLAISAIFAGIGLWMIFNPSFFNQIVITIVGILIILDSILAISQSVALRGAGYIRWWLSFLFGCATALLGALVIAFPFLFGNIAMHIVGAILVYDGISGIWIASRVKKHITNADTEPEYINVEAIDIDDDE